MIDIFNIKPNKVSRDLGGRSFLFYGGPKVGKTTLASRFPKSLILGFERGWGEIPGAMAVPVDTWADFIQILNMLRQDKKKEELAKKKNEEYECRYKTIVIDIADIAYSCCEKYVLAQQGVENVKDIPYGQGWNMIEKEFDTKLRSIVQLGFGLILISHAKFSTSDENPDIKYATCTLPSTAKKVCTRLVDIYGYISVDVNEEGQYIHTLHMRQSPYWEAGARLAYLPESIVLSYKNLVDSIHKAVDDQEKEMGVEFFTDEEININAVSDSPKYEDLMNSINSLINEAMNADESNGEKIAFIISNYLGKNRKLSSATEDNLEQLILIEQDLKDLA